MTSHPTEPSLFDSLPARFLSSIMDQKNARQTRNWHSHHRNGSCEPRHSNALLAWRRDPADLKVCMFLVPQRAQPAVDDVQGGHQGRDPRG